MEKSNKGKKVKLLLTNNSLDNGGAERVLVNLVNNLPQDKYDITLFTLYSSGIYDKSINKLVNYKYVFKKRGRFFNKVMLKILCKVVPFNWLRKFVVNKTFDYEIAFLQGYPTEFVRASKSNSTQKIAFVHSDFANNYDVAGFYKTKTQCYEAYKTFDKVCFISETAKNGFEKVIGPLSNAYIVHNVVDTESIRNQAKERSEQVFSENAFKIVSVGRLINLKAIDRIINAVEQVKKSGIRIECCIVGDGPERESLQQLIKDKKLENYIKIMGYCANPYKYVKQADLYVCSSLTEGYSTSAVEALILGVPILTTNVSGMHEIIGNCECGVIVDNTEDAFKEGLEMLAKDHDMIEKMKEEAKNRSMVFNSKVQIKEFMDMLEK